MWMPTHVQVTVQRASGLLTKGKNNKNDCFVLIALGKTKYQTSIKEKAGPDVEWHEECDLPIPDQGNTAEIVLTALHRNVFGVEEFLGRVAIPLNTLDIYERPKNKWYGLEAKPGKVGKAKERGHLEVKIGFTVKSGSLTDLSKKEKHKSSIGHVAQTVGGSLLSLGSAEKRKGIKKFARSIGSKMHLGGKKKDGDLDDTSIGSVGSLKRNFDKSKSQQTKEDADPGVVSDEDDFILDDLSHKSSVGSLNQPTSQGVGIIVSSAENVSGEISNKTAPSAAKPPGNEPKPQDEWEAKLFGKQSKNLLKPASSESLNWRSWDSTKLESQIEEEPIETSVTKDDINVHANKPVMVAKKDEKEGMLSKLKHFRKGGEKDASSKHISSELLKKFEGKSREDLILMVSSLQSDLESQKKKLKDLEDYLDDLLLRVMETTPRILQNPYVTCKFPHKKLSG